MGRSDSLDNVVKWIKFEQLIPRTILRLKKPFVYQINRTVLQCCRLIAYTDIPDLLDKRSIEDHAQKGVKNAD